MERIVSDSRFLKTLDKDELMRLIFFKSINIAKKREMHDVVKRMAAYNIVFGYDKAFKAHLKVYTNEELINILQDDDKTINAINDVDIILKKVASTNGHNILDSKYLDSILRFKKNIILLHGTIRIPSQ